MSEANMERINALSTRLFPYMQTIRATLWKNSVRNVVKNLEDGIGYEGVIEFWVEDYDDESETS